MATTAATDFIDYIFKFPDQGSFLRDPVISGFRSPTQGFPVQLLIYNPVETLQPPVPSVPSTIKPGNVLVLTPQLAVSSVALPGFWAMMTLRSSTTKAPALALEDSISDLLQEDNTSRLLLEVDPINGIFGALSNHPNIQIVNDRTLMFAQQPSVVMTKIDISHINIVINIFGVYVRDGLNLISAGPPPGGPAGTFLTPDSGAPILGADSGTPLLTPG